MQAKDIPGTRAVTLSVLQECYGKLHKERSSLTSLGHPGVTAETSGTAAANLPPQRLLAWIIAFSRPNAAKVGAGTLIHGHADHPSSPRTRTRVFTAGALSHCLRLSVFFEIIALPIGCRIEILTALKQQKWMQTKSQDTDSGALFLKEKGHFGAALP